MSAIKVFGIALIGILGMPWSVSAQEVPSPPIVPEAFYMGQVIEVTEERRDDIGVAGVQAFMQKVRVNFLDGPRTGQVEGIDYGVLQEEQKLKVGDRVVLSSPNDQTYIFDRYRLPTLWWLLALFVGLAVVFAGWRGLTSLLGLGISVLTLALYVVPQIMAGESPLMVSLIGALIITFVSIYLAHGFNQRTSVAVVSTVLTIIIAIGLATFFVNVVGLTGVGAEEAYHLQTSPLAFLNLKGLLLGGIIIGALGVLDDITTSQAAVVEEISRANPALKRRELLKRGMSVGREHITSLINTLALAYAGASFPALLLFTIYQRPWWVVVNTETIMEEIIRALVGSVALMAAVPITSFLAAWWFTRRPASTVKDEELTRIAT